MAAGASRSVQFASRGAISYRRHGLGNAIYGEHRAAQLAGRNMQHDHVVVFGCNSDCAWRDGYLDSVQQRVVAGMIGAERAVDNRAGDLEDVHQRGEHVLDCLFRVRHLLGQSQHLCRGVAAVEGIEIVPLGGLSHHDTGQRGDVGHAEAGSDRVKAEVAARGFEEERGLEAGGIEGERSIAPGCLLQFFGRFGRILQIDHLVGDRCAGRGYAGHFLDRCRCGAGSGRRPSAATSRGYRYDKKQHCGKKAVHGSTKVQGFIHFVSFCPGSC